MEEPISQLEQYAVRSGGINAAKQHDDMPPRPQYSMPGILHFLQTEWARFEMDRAQWEVDRAELQVQFYGEGDNCIVRDQSIPIHLDRIIIIRNGEIYITKIPNPNS